MEALQQHLMGKCWCGREHFPRPPDKPVDLPKDPLERDPEDKE